MTGDGNVFGLRLANRWLDAVTSIEVYIMARMKCFGGVALHCEKACAPKVTVWHGAVM